MKKGLLLVLATVSIFVVTSCSKEEDPTPGIQLATSPEALAEHDFKSGGLYKGTFANASASGNIQVILQAGKTEILIAYQGTTRTLTTTDLTGWTSGDSINAVFTSGNWSALFAASGNATSYSMGLNLAGTTAFEGLIVKEKSNAQVRVYEGTYAGDASGKWNICVQGNLMAGFYFGVTSGYLEGTISGTAITMAEPGGTVTAAGTFSNEVMDCSGTWQDGGFTGTWSSTRKI